MIEWLLLILQCSAAVMSLELLRTRVLPGLRSISHPALLLDVWGPIASILPMLALIQTTTDGVPPKWLVVGGPAIMPALGLALAMIVGLHRRDPSLEASPALTRAPAEPGIHVRSTVIWIGAAVLLVLVACAHELSVWTGQCSFALAATLLWLNTPETDASTSQNAESEAANDQCVWSGMTFVLLLAIAQGVCTGLIHRWAATSAHAVPLVSTSLIMLQMVVVLTLAARTVGAEAVMRWAGWAGAMGVLMAVGLVSLVQLLPTALLIIQGETPKLGIAMARGMSLFIWDSVFMLAAMSVAVLAPWTWPRVRILVGAAIGLAALAWVAFRLTAS